MKYGYVRVSTEKQDVDMQVDAMLKAGLTEGEIYRDIISGKITARDGLDGMLCNLKRGDTVYVWKLDRLGRKVSQLAALIDGFAEKGIHFVSLTEGFDVTSPAGKAMMGMAMVFAELERNNTSERTKAKLQLLKEQGRKLGRPPMYQEKYDEVRALRASGLSVRDVARQTGVSKSQVSKIERMEEP